MREGKKAGSTTAVTRRGRLFAALLQSLTKRNASRSATLPDLCPPLAERQAQPRSSAYSRHCNKQVLHISRRAKLHILQDTTRSAAHELGERPAQPQAGHSATPRVPPGAGRQKDRRMEEVSNPWYLKPRLSSRSKAFKTLMKFIF